jgi:membrane-associated protease RseP (regulator of RpoE activity)
MGRAFLGVTFDPGFSNAAVVRSITPGSPAEQAGLRAGDTVETLNDQTVTAYQDVLEAVRWMKPGDSLDIVASRRVSIRTQAVLEAASHNRHGAINLSTAPEIEGRGTVQASALDEPLPIPAVTRNRASRSILQRDTNASQSRRYLTNQDGGRSGNDRDNRRTSPQRNSRERGLFQRRRN